ncbi:MAG: hypothetical protein WD075_05435, partial [Rhodospirillales bacterium]
MALDNTTDIPGESPENADDRTLSGTDAVDTSDDAIVVAQAEINPTDPVTDTAPGPGTGIADTPVELDPDALAALLLAISQGQDLDTAMNEMLKSSLARAADLNASPESITAAIEAFRATILDIMSQGLPAEQAVIEADRAFLSKLQVAEEQQAGEQEAAVANALATGENIDQAVGEDTQAFEQALQAALDGGADIGEALAQAEAAQAAQDQIDAELAAATPADSLIAALSSGENVEQTVGALQGDGDGAAAEAFQNALVAALDEGGNVGDALQQAGQAAETSTLVSAEQQADASRADPLLSALATGNNSSGALGPDTSGMSPAEAQAANEAFQATLNQALNSGQSMSQALQSAGDAGNAAASASAEATAGEQGSVLAQLASGNTDGLGPDTSGMTPEQAAAANQAFQNSLSNALADGTSPAAALATAADTSSAAATATAEANAGEQGSVLAQLASGNADNLGPDTSGMSAEQAAAANQAFSQQLSNAVTDGATPAAAASAAETVSNIAANDATPDAGTPSGDTATTTQTANASPPPPPPATTTAAPPPPPVTTAP